jgi:hypothetical protein
MSEECSVLECGCEQGIFSNVVSGVVEVRDYLADETGSEFVVENPAESGFQTIDGEFLELN